jgi:dsDNA-specific endonuclease/ATPase MutS2
VGRDPIRSMTVTAKTIETTDRRRCRAPEAGAVGATSGAMVSHMAPRFAVGQTVQTPYGKGVVTQVRSRGHLLVDVRGHAWRLDDSQVSAPDNSSRPRSVPTERAENDRRSLRRRQSRSADLEVDLHGLTVVDALARADDALNRALLADASELRFIHGRSGGRIRAALHRRLREINGVRGFRLDPSNDGVTIVSL